jgi:hypothetical protein
MVRLMEGTDSKWPWLAGIWLQRLLPNPDEARVQALKARLAQLDPIRATFYSEL